MFKNEKGHTMVVVLTTMAILNIMIAGIGYSVSFTAKRSGINKDGAAAFNIAQAGEEAAIAMFRSKSITPVANTVTTLFSNTAFAGGTYAVQYTIDSTADTVQITSVGTFGKASRSIQTTYSAVVGAPTDPAYDYGIVAGGDMSWSGSGTCNTGSANVYCNGQFSMNGSGDFVCRLLSSSTGITMKGSGYIQGNVDAPQYSQSGSGGISGTTTTGPVAGVPIPNIDLTPYYNIALANGQVFSDTKISGSSDLVIPGGVMWVNGKFTYSGSGNITGTIIATGDIKISGSGDITATGTYPAIVSSGGDFTMDGSGNVTGLVYAKTGNIDKSGSGDVTGSMICGGDFSKSGSWSAFTYKNSAPVAPDGTGTATSYQEVSYRDLQ